MIFLEIKQSLRRKLAQGLLNFVISKLIILSEYGTFKILIRLHSQSE